MPVVAANATGTRTLVRDGVTGVLVPPRDITAYADVIAALESDRSRLAVMAAAGHARALEFEWDRVNAAVVESYLRLRGQAAR